MTDTIMDTITNTLTNTINTITNIVTPQVASETQVASKESPTIEQSILDAPTLKEPSTTTQVAIKKQFKPKPKIARPKHMDIYSTTLITRRIPVSIVNVGSNIKQTLEKVISLQIEGKCIVDGYVKSNSTKIISYSSGLVNGADIMFDVTFECLVCSPVEGMHIKCVAKNITKAGIRAETNETPSPVVIFIARDHHYNLPYFSTIKENDEIKVRVIGQRFELNDKYISIIAELLEPKEDKYKSFVSGPSTKQPLKKAKLVITG